MMTYGGREGFLSEIDLVSSRVPSFEAYPFSIPAIRALKGGLKLHPGDTSAARHFLEGFVPHLDQAGLGTISEIFDAEPPYTPRGCIAQGWSVAEVLRAWVKTAGRAA